MKISVALCTYNGEKFLREQLDSIARQTLPADELVVCDDCSNDRTMEILQEFSKRVSFPVHIHSNEKNLGSTRNFENAINLCSGDIIALCDQDDVWRPNKLTRLMAVLEAHPEAGYVFSNATLVDEELQSLDHSLWESVGFRGEIRQNFEKGEQISCFARQHVVTGATMAFRASLRELAMPFPTVGNWIHDGWIALVSSATGQPGVPVDEHLIAYRQHANQQVGAPSPHEEKQKKSLLAMHRELKANQRALFTGWESHCLHILKVREILTHLQEKHPSTALEKHLSYFQGFETHFLSPPGDPDRRRDCPVGIDSQRAFCRQILEILRFLAQRVQGHFSVMPR